MKAFAWTLLIAACADAPLADGVQPSPANVFGIPQATLFDPWDPPRFPAWTQPPPAPIEPPATIAYAPTVETISETATSAAIKAMPSNPITLMAVTDDGGTVISADLLGTARIWPTLDGFHEPVVVPLRAPTALALTRNGDRLVAAALDGAGQLELVIAKTTGEVERRIAIEAVRPFIAVHAIGAGFVALDDERAIHTIGADGNVSAPLVADPEQHVASLVVRGAHVLAIIESEGKIHGRWVDAGHPPRWGEATALLPLAIDRLALAPDGKRIAGVLLGGRRVGIIDLATGKQLARTPANESVDPRFGPIGFANDRWLAIEGVSGEKNWWDGEGSLDESFFSESTVVVGDRGIVGSQGLGLVVGKPNEYAEYLGYRMGGAPVLRAFGNRLLTTDSLGVIELDANFRTRKVHTLPAPEQPVLSWSNLMVIDERHVLASTYVGNHYVVYLITLDGKEAKLVVKDGYPSEFEPSTQLLTYRTTGAFWLVKFDRETSTFGKAVSIPFDVNDNATIKLLDPKKSKGNIAGIVEANGANARVTMIDEIHPEQATSQIHISSMRTVELDERWWSRVGDYNKLVDPGTPKIRGPGGKRVELRDTRIILTDARGATLWTVPARSATGVLWTDTGRLIAFGAGIAELDVATGALGARQCGWRFGRWPTDLEGFGPAHLCE